MSFSAVIDYLIEKYFSLKKKNISQTVFDPEKILIIRQHNQFGDLLASVSIFRALKENYTDSKITVIVSKDNYFAITKNKFVDKTFLFDKTQLFNPRYYFRLSKVLRNDYDVCIVPVTVAISDTSCILCGLSDARMKIGPASLDGKENKLSNIFDKSVVMNWQENPDRNVSDFGQDILKPLGIRTNNLTSEITFDKEDLKYADLFLTKNEINKRRCKLVGLHVGAGKIPNRWSSEKFAELIKLISKEMDVSFYLTGTDADLECINGVLNKIEFVIPLFLNKTVPEVAALISKSDLFITNDTGIMHVAGAVSVPQISIFGPTNPLNWAPVGKNKYWIKNSDDIDSVSIKEIFDLAGKILSTNNNRN